MINFFTLINIVDAYKIPKRLQQTTLFTAVLQINLKYAECLTSSLYITISEPFLYHFTSGIYFTKTLVEELSVQTDHSTNNHINYNG